MDLRQALRAALRPPPASLRGGGGRARARHRRQHRRLQRGRRGAAAAAAVRGARAAGPRSGRASPSATRRFVEVSYPVLPRGARAQPDDGRRLAAMPSTNSGFTLGGPRAGARRGRDRDRQLLRRAAERTRPWAATFVEAEDKVGVAARRRGEPRALAAAVRRRPGTRGPHARGGRHADDGGRRDAARVPLPARASDLWTPLVPVIPEVVDKANVGWADPDRTARAGRDAGAGARRRSTASTAERLRARLPSAPAVKTVLTPLAHEWFGPARPALFVLLGAVLPRAAPRLRERVRPPARPGRGARSARSRCGWPSEPRARGSCASSWPRPALIAAGGRPGRHARSRCGASTRCSRCVPAEIPRLEDAAIDPRVLAFALVLTAVSRARLRAGAGAPRLARHR